MTKYEKAILDTIAYAEGTLGVSQNGYDILVGFKTIVGWTENTNIRHRCVKPTGDLTKSIIEQKGYEVCEDDSWFLQERNSKGKLLQSSAAGRYQYLGSSWATTTENIGLEFNAPMTKKNQNKACIYTVKNKRKVTEQDLMGSYDDFNTFRKTIKKMEEEWTSFKLNNTNDRKTPKDYWIIYKHAVNSYG